MISFLAAFICLYSVYQLASLAGIFSERSGTANVAIEGNMIVGAIVFILLYQLFGFDKDIYSVLFAIIITVPLAGLYMMLLSVLTNRYFADHIVAGTGMNILAPALMMMLYWILSPTIVGYNRPSSVNFIVPQWYIQVDGFASDLSYIHLFLLLVTLLITLLSFVILNKTRFGLRLKSSGENPYSLETSGVSVKRTRAYTLYISGMLSSLSGIVFMTKGTFFFTVNGSGFLAIGILVLGQYRVIGTTIGSIVLAAFIALFDTLPLFMGSGVAELTYMMKIIPFLIPIIGLIIFKKSYMPKTVGENFKKDQR